MRMGKKLITVRLGKDIIMEIEKLKDSERFNNRTEVVEEALERGLKVLKDDSFSKY